MKPVQICLSLIILLHPSEISKYPKKNPQILFIEDRVQQVPTNDFLREAGNVRKNQGSAGQYGDLGQFSDYIGGGISSSYTYVQSNSIITLEGSGGVGFGRQVDFCFKFLKLLFQTVLEMSLPLPN